MYNGGDPNMRIDTFLKRSNPKIKKKLEFILGIIADESYVPKEPYVKHFTIEKYKSLYELRLKVKGNMLRVIYYEADKNIILLHAFAKKDKRDTVRALDYSLKLIEQLERESLTPFNNLTEVNLL